MWLRNPARAAGLFRHAASYFGSAEAQYDLALLYLDGTGVEKSPSLAVNWLAMAAKKQHAAAQATLGELLWRGSDDIRQRQARGLALIILAHANASAAGAEPKWIGELYREARGASTPAMLKEAQALAPRAWRPHLWISIQTVTAPPAEDLLLPAGGDGAAGDHRTGARRQCRRRRGLGPRPAQARLPLGFGATPDALTPSN